MNTQVGSYFFLDEQKSRCRLLFVPITKLEGLGTGADKNAQAFILNAADRIMSRGYNADPEVVLTFSPSAQQLLDKIALACRSIETAAEIDFLPHKIPEMIMRQAALLGIKALSLLDLGFTQAKAVIDITDTGEIFLKMPVVTVAVLQVLSLQCFAVLMLQVVLSF